MKDSPDLKYAKQVADHIGSTHHELVVTQDELTSMIKPTIYQVETYDTTTIRASIPMYTLSKYIRKNHPEIVVIFSGEGSDEICGSYMYFHNAPNEKSFHNECRRLIDELHQYDLLRGDKCTAGSGLEIRLPFLDKSFVNFYLSLPIDWRVPKYHTGSHKIEKYFLRSSFHTFGSDKNGCRYLPSDVIWRVKEAFSDGVSSIEYSWSNVLQNVAEETYSELEHNAYSHWLPPYTKENFLYRDTFESYYLNRSMFVLSHYWLPKWSGDVSDPSARKLEKYSILHNTTFIL
jgi:asparagine synthase (glutamine-hydrolysing)